MKVKEEDLRRELIKAINGEDLIINCIRRLGIRLDSFKCKLYTARIHGIESVLHSNRPGGYGDDFKHKVVDSLMKGMTKHAAARTLLETIYFNQGGLRTKSYSLAQKWMYK